MQRKSRFTETAVWEGAEPEVPEGNEIVTDKTGFRIQGTRYLLTYKSHIVKDDLSEFLGTIKDSHKIIQFIAAHETADSKNPYQHTHAYVDYGKKFESENCRIFDWVCEDGSIIHPHIRTCKNNVDKLFRYLAKEDPENAHLLEKCESLAAKVQKYSSKKELLEKIEMRPIEVSGYLKAWEIMNGGTKKYVHKFTKDSFNRPQYQNFKCIFITGIKNCGKTQWALSHFENPHLVRHNDQLKSFVPGFHDGIVFDDMNFHHWPRTSFIHLCDWDEDSEIHCRNTCGFIPAGTRKIFVSNEKYHEVVPDDHTGAILRRFSHIIGVYVPLTDEVIPEGKPFYENFGEEPKKEKI